MCNDIPNKSDVPYEDCDTYEFTSIECEQCCVQKHSVSCCAFWNMVYKFPYTENQPEYICGTPGDPALGVPAPEIRYTADIAGLVNLNPSNHAVYMFAGPNSDDTTNAYINIVTALTADPQFQGVYNESIPLFKGLIANYPNGQFNFYKAIDPDNQQKNVTFYVVDLDGNLDNYYCDITVLFP